jgi:hypothetical protein
MFPITRVATVQMGVSSIPGSANFGFFARFRERDDKGGTWADSSISVFEHKQPYKYFRQRVIYSLH